MAVAGLRRRSTPDTYGQEYDPEIKMWVAKKADAMAWEMKGRNFVKGLLQMRRSRRTIYNQFGRPVGQIKMSDSGNTEHEFDNHQDAVARPLAVVPKTRFRHAR